MFWMDTMELYSHMDRQGAEKHILCLVAFLTHIWKVLFQDQCKFKFLISSEHIFSQIKNIKNDIEFIMTCSMLEIYKENLFDLLSSQRNDLKIKESP